MNKSDKKTLSDVAEYGWHVVMVFEDDEGPGFAYTVGLYQTFRHPEILIIGLNVDLMSNILNSVGDDIKTGTIYEAGKEYSEIVENYKCSFQKIDESFYTDFLGTGIWFYKGKPFPALQCVYPDISGHYPWHKNCNPALIEMQPLLTGTSL
ncbi:MAG TPA: DUF4262 domain-containing protein [Pyrinomonadaceae bacterium]|nr:DUF4262 domain-containing protein [Pyrinomonadaceae bacterium]